MRFFLWRRLFGPEWSKTEDPAIEQFARWLTLMVTLTAIAAIIAVVLVVVAGLRVAAGIEILMAGPVLALVVELRRFFAERFAERVPDEYRPSR